MENSTTEIGLGYFIDSHESGQKNIATNQDGEIFVILYTCRDLRKAICDLETMKGKISCPAELEIRKIEKENTSTRRKLAEIIAIGKYTQNGEKTKKPIIDTEEGRIKIQKKVYKTSESAVKAAKKKRRKGENLVALKYQEFEEEGEITRMLIKILWGND